MSMFVVDRLVAGVVHPACNLKLLITWYIQTLYYLFTCGSPGDGVDLLDIAPCDPFWAGRADSVVITISKSRL